MYRFMPEIHFPERTVLGAIPVAMFVFSGKYFPAFLTQRVGREETEGVFRGLIPHNNVAAGVNGESRVAGNKLRV